MTNYRCNYLTVERPEGKYWIFNGLGCTVRRGAFGEVLFGKWIADKYMNKPYGGEEYYEYVRQQLLTYKLTKYAKNIDQTAMDVVDFFGLAKWWELSPECGMKFKNEEKFQTWLQENILFPCFVFREFEKDAWMRHYYGYDSYVLSDYESKSGKEEEYKFKVVEGVLIF